MRVNEHLVLKSDDTVLYITNKEGKICFIRSYDEPTQRTELMAKFDEVREFCEKNAGYSWSMGVAGLIQIKEEVEIDDEF